MSLDLSKVAKRNPTLNKKIIVAQARGDKYKKIIKDTLIEFCNNAKLTLVEEHLFALEIKRRFRFDYAVPEIKLAIEYEGIYSSKSRHTSKVGYSQDAIKYNMAATLGWTVLRYTSSTTKHIKSDLQRFSSLK